MNDRRKANPPHLRLEMEASTWLSTTLPYYITVMMKRDEEPGTSEPCIFYWNPDEHGLGPSGFELWRQATAGGPESIELEHPPRLNEKTHPGSIVVNGWNDFLWELSPGRYTRFLITLPERYQKALVVGEIYELLWPGGKIAIWAEGSIRDNLKQELRASDKGDRLILPGRPSVSFTVVEEAPPWHDRAKVETKRGYMLANLQELHWRREQERIRNPPPSPAAIDVSERVYGPTSPL